MLQPIPLFDQLKSEHEELKQLLREAKDCQESERKEMLTKIEEGFVPHARGEEKTLYSVMNERASEEKAKELTSEAYEEHNAADKLLADLKATDVSDEQWVAKLKVLKENIEHHIEEEETQLFEEAQQVFDSREFEALLTAYQIAKEQFAETLPSQSQIQSRTPTQSLEL